MDALSSGPAAAGPEDKLRLLRAYRRRTGDIDILVCRKMVPSVIRYRDFEREVPRCGSSSKVRRAAADRSAVNRPRVREWRRSTALRHAEVALGVRSHVPGT